MYHFDADAPEHLHHKGNATLQSQVGATCMDYPLPVVVHFEDGWDVARHTGQFL